MVQELPTQSTRPSHFQSGQITRSQSAGVTSSIDAGQLSLSRLLRKTIKLLCPQVIAHIYKGCRTMYEQEWRLS